MPDEDESPRLEKATPIPVNNILLDPMPEEYKSDALPLIDAGRDSVAITEEENYRDNNSSPKYQYPKTSAVYESVSVDIKC